MAKHPRPATVAELLKKQPLERTVELVAEQGGEPLTVKFRSIGRVAYEALLDAHQPTDEQRAKGRAQKVKVEWNPDTFPPALIAAAAVDPVFSLDEATELWESDDWNGEELLPLFFAAVAVNTSRWANTAAAVKSEEEAGDVGGD